MCEADNYFAPVAFKLFRNVALTAPDEWRAERIAAARAACLTELENWAPGIRGDYLCGALSAADYTLYPLVALMLRNERKKPDLGLRERLPEEIDRLDATRRELALLSADLASALELTPERAALSFEHKLCAQQEFAARAARLPRPLVFTNGVFDLLHRGHVTYLAQARALGASLAVGVNSDNSVKRLGKGEDRPLNTLADRMAVLAASGVGEPRDLVR